MTRQTPDPRASASDPQPPGVTGTVRARGRECHAHLGHDGRIRYWPHATWAWQYAGPTVAATYTPNEEPPVANIPQAPMPDPNQIQAVVQAASSAVTMEQIEEIIARSRQLMTADDDPAEWFARHYAMTSATLTTVTLAALTPEVDTRDWTGYGTDWAGVTDRIDRTTEMRTQRETTAPADLIQAIAAWIAESPVKAAEVIIELMD